MSDRAGLNGEMGVIGAAPPIKVYRIPAKHMAGRETRRGASARTEDPPAMFSAAGLSASGCSSAEP